MPIEPDHHDLSAIDALSDHYAKRRDDELAASMAAEAAKIDVARTAARATLIKRAGVAALLGGIGLGAALFGGSFLLKPKIVTVEKLTERIIEKPVDRVVEKVVEKPVYITKKEDDFIHRPDYEAATNKGRIIKSKDGIGVFFDNDTSFIPVDTTRAYDTDRLVSDFGFCTPIPNTDHFLCYAIDHDVTVPITTVPKKMSAAAPAGGIQSCLTASPDGRPILGAHCAPPAKSSSVTSSARDPILVDVDLGSETIINAMVDTGCSWPLSLPRGVADALIKTGRAVRRGSSKSKLADGTTINADVILIGAITVDGRVLKSVEATVAPSDSALVLLGLGALNRLGPYSIENGRIVFTGSPT